MNQAAIGVGSNIDPDQNIPQARGLLSEQFTVLAESEFTLTTPVGTTNQADFMNGAWLIETDLDPLALKKKLQGIEQEIGRIRSADPNGPRSIDLDIVVWNGEIVDEDYHQRDFLRAAIDAILPNKRAT